MHYYRRTFNSEESYLIVQLLTSRISILQTENEPSTSIYKFLNFCDSILQYNQSNIIIYCVDFALN